MPDKRLVMVGIKKKGESSFKISADSGPDTKPAKPAGIIHNGTGVKRCSECGHPVNAPEGACTTCTVCGQQHGGCG